ncbi:leukocyte surface antigen CD47-like [Nannospalax galili]|uniref:leukocyte surface antigen CD47-like n=1 Tax=Nannospalax galili TaxID=1026970 RepID=UPI0004ED17F4|nr:leukocyte surface antigen CD47-like [Nannospalax galili]
MKYLYFSFPGSAQIMFQKIKSVEFNSCNKTILIPCYISNIEAERINDLYLQWKFKERAILIFDGALNKSTKNDKFLSAEIDSSEFLKGNASLKLNKEDAKVGNYTCEVTELSREGITTVELKYRNASWFYLSKNIFIVIFPFLAILLFWAQFGILLQKYKSNPMNKKMIFLTAAGLLVTIVVIIGAILFIPCEMHRYCGGCRADVRKHPRSNKVLRTKSRNITRATPKSAIEANFIGQDVEADTDMGTMSV